ncbi:XdhC family protein, partial [bacterium]|nr:XdhC family protein [bacterium]
MNLNKKALELERENKPFAWATIVAHEGSTPRHLGSKMIIVSQGEIYDTIGGGNLEHNVIQDAIELIRTGEAKTIEYPLAAKLGQCCGGSVSIFIEPILPRRKVIIFGAGHVAGELVPLLLKLKFDVTVTDEREEQINKTVFDNCTKTCCYPEDILRKIGFDEKLYIIVLTHDHKHDEAIVKHCLDKPYFYLGVIGSKTKWDKFK